MTFLIQLENDTWACRGRCQRLHPRKEFPPRQLKKYAPQKRICEVWAGLIDRCPCISLTLRDCTHSIDYLEAPKTKKLSPGFRWTDFDTVPSCTIQDCCWVANTKYAI